MATHSIFLPGKSHGQRSLVGYSPQGLRVRHDLATKQQESIEDHNEGNFKAPTSIHPERARFTLSPYLCILTFSKGPYKHGTWRWKH